jgi:hypothetical protein
MESHAISIFQWVHDIRAGIEPLAVHRVSSACRSTSMLRCSSLDIAGQLRRYACPLTQWKMMRILLYQLSSKLCAVVIRSQSRVVLKKMLPMIDQLAASTADLCERIRF